MVDKNKDGIDDLTGKPVKAKPKVEAPQGIAGAWNGFRGAVNDTAAGIGNLLGDVGAFFGSTKQTPGNGMGDQWKVALESANPVYRTPKIAEPWRGGMSMDARDPVQPDTEQAPAKTLADYLAAASQLMGDARGGVNYDPQRSAARSQAAENDARLEAMYRQLRGSIDADAPVLQQAYQTAIDSTAKNATDAQAQTQAATDAANARNNEVLANLGIQQAQGNIIQNGTDLNTQTAQRMADQATKGQAAGDRLVSNQATALQHNTNIGNAAGLEGNLQRAANQAKLQSLLAEIDMQEQQANQSAGSNALSQKMSLANSLLDFDRYNQEREDGLQQSAAELAAKGQQSLPDLGTYLQALGINPEDIAKDPSKYGSLLSALTKFGITS